MCACVIKFTSNNNHMPPPKVNVYISYLLSSFQGHYNSTLKLKPNVITSSKKPKTFTISTK